ncbi:hypothetical protein ACJRO7_031134 [Eucalyptus globulus]|uniref:Scarecrow-like protein 32 n=1 Tax=Eucalyptus globulus TaxID=34317 RepID=A0ABD3JPF5_EUCGL
MFDKGFLRALIPRTAKSGTCNMLAAMVYAQNYDNLCNETHKFSIIELANFVDMTPWHRLGFTSANATIIEAVEGYSLVHIVDLSTTHCMQIPTLIDAIANHLEGPPLVKVTVAGAVEDGPPMLDLSYEELGSKLVNFARSRNIHMEFQAISSSYADGFSSLIEQLRMQKLMYSGGIGEPEALVINCHMMLHFVPDETFPLISDSEANPNHPFESSSVYSPRLTLLKALRCLDSNVVILVDEDADFTSNNVASRLRSAFNYLWIPHDTVDTFLPRGSKQRQWHESYIYRKIQNVLAQEALQRIERLEPKSRWAHRTRNVEFRAVPFGEDTVSEVKAMLDEHGAGWGLKKNEDDLALTWKGHNVAFATAWLPA